MPARILIVEHQVVHLDEMTRLLLDAGHHVYPARDGDQGLQTVRRERPALVLSAVAPPSRGLEVLASMRRDRLFDGTRVVAVTFFTAPEDRHHLLACGFDGVIAKPVARDSFLAQVEGFLPGERE